MGKTRVRIGMILVLFLGVGGQPAQLRAGYESQTFDFTLSNDMTDGVVYGTVKIEANNGPDPANGLGSGKVRFTVTPANVYGGVGSNFGIQSFGFNPDRYLAESDIKVPDGWSKSTDANISEFGVFSWKLSGNGNNRQDPLIILVENLNGDATIDHFLHTSKDKESVPGIYFTAHVAGFNGEPSSHHIAVPKPQCDDPPPPPPGGGGEPARLPEPSSLALSLLAVGALGVARLVRRRRTTGEVGA